MHIDRPIAIALIIFIILLLIFFLVLPEYNKFKELRTELGEKKAEYIAQYDYYSAISKVYFELQSRGEDIKKVDDALPQNSNFGEIIYFFQRTAEEKGLVVKNLFLSKSSKINPDKDSSSKVKNITFSIDLLGNYSSLGNFITALEKSSRIFEITSISFNSDSKKIPYNFILQVKTQSY